MEENKVKNSTKTEENEAAHQVTSTIKKTKPKDPGRVAAGKKVAEHKKKFRKAKLKKTDVKDESKIEKTESEEKTSPLSINQMISIAGIAVSIAGLYYKRKEIMKVLNKKESEGVTPSETKANLEHQREANLERQREVKLERQREKKYTVKSMD